MNVEIGATFKYQYNGREQLFKIAEKASSVRWLCTVVGGADNGKQLSFFNSHLVRILSLQSIVEKLPAGT